MANNLISTTTTFIIVLLFSLVKSQRFSTSLPPSTLQLGKQNLTHLRFFFHDMTRGPNATAIRVAEAPNVTDTSPTGFGFVAIDDNMLTVGPEPNSTRVGKSQGMYASADFSEESFMMVQNHVFYDKKFNGSTLSILGRNPVFNTQLREFPVVGGSGVFRFASGYAEVKTYLIAPSGNAIFEYNVYVLHY